MSEADDKKLWVVLWPDGNVLDGSPSTTRAGACANAVRYWLPREWFKGLDLASLYYGPLSELWNAMERAGFKLIGVKLPADEEPKP